MAQKEFTEPQSYYTVGSVLVSTCLAFDKAEEAETHLFKTLMILTDYKTAKMGVLILRGVYSLKDQFRPEEHAKLALKTLITLQNFTSQPIPDCQQSGILQNFIKGEKQTDSTRVDLGVGTLVPRSSATGPAPVPKLTPVPVNLSEDQNQEDEESGSERPTPRLRVRAPSYHHPLSSARSRSSSYGPLAYSLSINSLDRETPNGPGARSQSASYGQGIRSRRLVSNPWSVDLSSCHVEIATPRDQNGNPRPPSSVSNCPQETNFYRHHVDPVSVTTSPRPPSPPNYHEVKLRAQMSVPSRPPTPFPLKKGRSEISVNVADLVDAHTTLSIPKLDLTRFSCYENWPTSPQTHKMLEGEFERPVPPTPAFMYYRTGQYGKSAGNVVAL